VAESDDGLRDHYLRGLGISTRNNALAYGFSISVTATFGVLQYLDGPGDVPRIMLFVVGSALPFPVLNALVTRGFRRRVDREPPLVLAVGTSLSLFSIAAAVGLAALIAWAVRGWGAWIASPFAATVVYLLASAAEVAAGRGLHAVAGTENLEKR
jgi:hypothetical protein